MRRAKGAALALGAGLLAGCGAGEETAPVNPAPVEVEVIEAEAAPTGLLEPLQGTDVWMLDPEASTLTFDARQGEEAFTGRFGRFDAQIRLDPDDLSDASILAAVDLGSVDAGSADRNDSLPEADWFDIARFPRAEFRSTSVSRTGSLYEAPGILSLKGVERPVTLAFTLEIEGDRAVADGQFRLDRTDYSVGTGEFGTEEFVDNDVNVLVHIEATRAP